MRTRFSGRSKMRVLIADDSGIVIERLADLLNEVSGVEVVGQAGNALQASLSIQQLNPDVVILDLQMPGGSGLDVLLAVRRRRSNRIMIILTNYSYPQYRQRCLDAGANFFLDKSTDFEKIPAILRTLIQNAAKSASSRG